MVHACLEGTEAGVYYRGRGTITNNYSSIIELPDYVCKIANNFTIQITPIYNRNLPTSNYAVSNIENNTFQVYGMNGEFFWIVQGKRLHIDVEPRKSEVQLNGDGPYKWISSDK